MSKVSKVVLREKLISKERLSFYLDFYPPVINPNTGKETRREGLKMYIPQKPKTPKEKKQVKEIRAAAEAIRAKRQMEIYEGSYGLNSNQNQAMDFLAYFYQFVSKHENGKRNTYLSWKSAYLHLEHYCKGKLNSDNITKGFVENYRNYLNNAISLSNNSDRPLAQNTKVIYFSKFCTVVKSAYQDKFLSENPTEFVKGFKAEETTKRYLTFEEFKQLFDFPFDDKTFVTVCKIATYTGIRHSDIKKMKWSEIRHSESLGHYIDFTQKKVTRKQKLPINETVFQLLGERKNDDDLIFPKMGCTSSYRRKLMLWTARAGITKHITFHCLRHTYATLQYANGTDIYTISKMLGHSSIKHTEVYAKIMDNTKVKAANAIPMI